MGIEETIQKTETKETAEKIDLLDDVDAVDDVSPLEPEKKTELREILSFMEEVRNEHQLLPANFSIRYEPRSLPNIDEFIESKAIEQELKRLESESVNSKEAIKGQIKAIDAQISTLEGESVNSEAKKILLSIKLLMQRYAELVLENIQLQEKSGALREKFSSALLSESGINGTEELLGKIDQTEKERWGTKHELNRLSGNPILVLADLAKPIIGQKRQIPELRQKYYNLTSESTKLHGLQYINVPYTHIEDVETENRKIEHLISGVAAKIGEQTLLQAESGLIRLESLPQVEEKLSKEKMEQLNLGYLELVLPPQLAATNPELREKLIQELPEIFSTDFNLVYGDLDYSTKLARKIEVSEKAKVLMEELSQDGSEGCEQLRYKLLDIMNQVEQDKKFEDLNFLFSNFERIEKLNEILGTFNSDLEMLANGSFSALGADSYFEIQARIRSLRLYIGSAENGNFLKNLANNFDLERWQIISHDQEIIAQFGQERISQVGNLIANRLLEKLFDSTEDSGKRDTAEKLFEFHDPKVAPFVILNAYTLKGYGGIREFMTPKREGENCKLVDYILSFSEDEIEELNNLNIPGLVELVNLIRQKPENYKNSASFPQENEDGEIVQKHLDTLLSSMLQRGSGKEISYFMEILGSKGKISDEIYTIISKIDTDPSVLSMLKLRVANGETKAMDQMLKSLMNSKEKQASINRICSAAGNLGIFSVPKSEEEKIAFNNSLKNLLDEVLRYAKDLTPNNIGFLLSAYNYVEGEGTNLNVFLSSDEFKNNFPSIFTQSDRAAELILTRIIQQGDANCEKLLLELINDESTNSFMHGKISEVLMKAFMPHRNDAENLSVETIQKRQEYFLEVIGWLDEEGAKGAQAGQILADFFGRITPTAISELEWSTFFTKEIMTKIQSVQDPEITYYLLEAAQKLRLPVENFPEEIIKVYKGELNSGVWSHHSSLARLATDQNADYTPEQAAQILATINLDQLNGQDCELIKFLLNKDLITDKEKATELNLLLIYRQIISGRETIEIDTSVPFDENWEKLLAAYLETDQEFRLTPEQVSSLVEIFQDEQNKNLVLKNFQELYLKTLNSLQEGQIPFTVNLLTDLVKRNEGAGQLKYVEALSNLINQLKNLSKDSNVAAQSRVDGIASLSRQEERFVKEKWSEADKAIFYNISAEIIQASPALYTDFAQVFNRLSPKQLKQFNAEVLPLYQAQLVILQKEGQTGENPAYNLRDLVQIRRTLEQLEFDLDGGKTSEELFPENKAGILQVIKEKFKDRFGLIKVPDEMDKEKIQSLQNIVRYLGNLNGRNAQKELILSFYLGLMLNEEWQSFRQGEEINPSEYFEGQNLTTIQNFLKERSSGNPITAENLGISEENLPDFQTLLQDETVSQLIGSVETIDIKIGNVARSIEDLKDEDAYPDEKDKGILRLYLQYDKLVGSTLAKTFQEASGKQMEFSTDERLVQRELAEIFSVETWQPEQVKKIQEEVRTINLITRMIKNIESQNVSGSIEELQRRLVPPSEVVNIFNKIGEEFKVSSGAMALSQDLTYLESIIVKSDEKLDEDEKTVLKNYLRSIREQMTSMEKILEQVTDQFNQIRQSLGSSHSEVLSSRIEEIGSLISDKQNSIEIISRTTSNMNLIIPNMRQCLGCLTKECNNDTNLTFGDMGKFYLMSQSGKQEGSISDEIVLFAPVTKDDGSREMTFMMDRIYGLKSADVLLSHVNSLLKKMRQIKTKFPEAKISILVTNESMSGCGLSTGIMAERIRQLQDGINISVTDNIEVDVVKSAAGDYYTEVGNGSPRETGPRQVGGIILT